MTGLEALREELMKRGLNKAQANSNAVAVTLDILANTGTLNIDILKLEREKQGLEIKIEELQNKMAWWNTEKAKVEREARAIDATIQQRMRGDWMERYEYVEKVMQALEECETAEGRDSLRKAQMFVNSVDVNSKYDNTAYIIGLAAILSNDEVAPVDELKKINKKLFSFEGMWKA